MVPDDTANGARGNGGVRFWGWRLGSCANENPDTGRHVFPLSPSEILQMLQYVSIMCVEEISIPRSKALQVPSFTRLEVKKYNNNNNNNRGMKRSHIQSRLQKFTFLWQLKN